MTTALRATHALRALCVLTFILYNNCWSRYYYFSDFTDGRHREVNIFDRRNMQGKCDLKAVKDIHAKALLSAYSNCTPLDQEGGKRKKSVVRLHKSGKRPNTKKTFEKVLTVEGRKRGISIHSQPLSPFYTFWSPRTHSVESLLLYHSCHLIF